MTMTFSSTIGENIKRVRKEHGVTQEALAERLGLSCQAVSKWERGESLPDVSYIIPIANFFRVSADDLLGLSPARREETIRSYIEKLDALSAEGKDEEREQLLNRAYTEYPDDYRLMNLYMTHLYNLPENEDGSIPGKEELYRLCNGILAGCSDEKIRFHAMDVLADLYAEDSRIEDATALLAPLPSAFETRAQKMQFLYAEGDPERLLCIRRNVADMLESTVMQVRQLVREDAHLRRSEQMTLLQSCVALIETLISDHSYGLFHYHLSDLYFRIANRFMMAKDAMQALDYLSKAFHHAQRFDELPDDFVYTAPSLAGVTFRREDRPEISSGSKVEEQFAYLETTCKSLFAPIAETPVFTEMLRQYRK